jgi:hypothetical protein
LEVNDVWRSESRAEDGAADSAADITSQLSSEAEPVQAGDGGRRLSDDVAASVGLAGAGVFALGLIFAMAAHRREIELDEREAVLARGRPRKSLTRYATTLGLWELSRRTTSYAVTENRVVVDRGIFRRRTHSIPLSGIVDVDVVGGVVRISEHGDSQPAEEIGPLPAQSARRLATTITRAMVSR